MTPARDCILFDLDGTLVDSAPDILNALNRVLVDRGLAPRALSEVRDWIRFPAQKLVGRALAAASGDDGDTPEVVAKFLAAYAADPVRDSVIFPGGEDMLDTLADSGHRLAVCTNKPSKTAFPVLRALDLERRFRAIVCGDRTEHPKPDPRHVFETLEALGGSPDRAVFVGDSDSDALAAAAAGVPCVLVSFGYCSTPLAELPHAAIIESLGELPDILDRLSGSGARR